MPAQVIAPPIVKSFLPWLLLAATLIALVLGLRSAASATKDPATTPTEGWPRIEREGERVRIVGVEPGPIELAQPPRRILPANAAFVDFLSLLTDASSICALPKASDDYSRLKTDGDELPGWRELERFPGYGAEAILPFEPDLVLAHSWQKADVAALLRDAGVPVLVLPMPRRWEDIETTLTLLAEILGREEHAANAITAQRERIEALRARTERAGLSAISYTNLGTGGTVAGSGTTADILFELAGLENAAARAGHVEYESLDLEGLLQLDPDVIVVDGVHGDSEAPPTAAFLEAQDGLAGMRALRNGRVISLPTELFTTTSQEILRGAEALVQELEARGL